MPFTRKAIASVWLVVAGLFALSASGTIAGRDVLWLVLAALMAPAILLTLDAKLQKRGATAALLDARAVAASDAHDLLRMDSDKG